MPAEILLMDEAQTEVIRLSFAQVTPSSSAKIPRLIVGHRYTNPVWYSGADARAITIHGQFIPPFTSIGSQWTTSSGNNPIPTIQKWKRLGTRLTYLSDVETLTSVNVMNFHYTLMPGVPLTQIIYFNLELKAGIEP